MWLEILLASVLAFVVYWFVSRDKEETLPLEDGWWGPGARPTAPEDESIRPFKVETSDEEIKVRPLPQAGLSRGEGGHAWLCSPGGWEWGALRCSHTGQGQILQRRAQPAPCPPRPPLPPTPLLLPPLPRAQQHQVMGRGCQLALGTGITGHRQHLLSPPPPPPATLGVSLARESEQVVIRAWAGVPSETQGRGDIRCWGPERPPQGRHW